MAYCTLNNLTTRIPEHDLIQLTDDDDQGQVNETVVTDTIASVSEMIDGFLRGRYALPLLPVPGMIRAIAVDLVIYDLYGRRPTFGIPEAVEKKQAAQMKVLKQIQDGVVTLGSAGTTSPAAELSANTIQAAPPRPVFTPDTLRNY